VFDGRETKMAWLIHPRFAATLLYGDGGLGGISGRVGLGGRRL
jgi:hypothetical protein